MSAKRTNLCLLLFLSHSHSWPYSLTHSCPFRICRRTHKYRRTGCVFRLRNRRETKRHWKLETQAYLAPLPLPLAFPIKQLAEFVSLNVAVLQSYWLPFRTPGLCHSLERERWTDRDRLWFKGGERWGGGDRKIERKREKAGRGNSGLVSFRFVSPRFAMLRYVTFARQCISSRAI